MDFRGWFLSGILLLGGVNSASACTLVGAAGSSVEGGGTLLLKLRDTSEDHDQVVKRVYPTSGFSYTGIFAVPRRGEILSPVTQYPLKAGINEKGLAVVVASASSVDSEVRQGEYAVLGLLPLILGNFESIEEVLAHPELLRGARILMLADQKGIARIEVAPGSKYQVVQVNDGVLVATNHYQTPEFQKWNTKEAHGSETRLSQVKDLLTSSKAWSFDSFFSLGEKLRRDRSRSVFVAQNQGNESFVRTSL